MPQRILVADDFEPWRRFVSSTLQKHMDVQSLIEVSDGLEAVCKSEDFRPDLIVLDIGLPTLNGIEAARRIRDLSPDSKILFLSEESSPDVAEVALEAGGAGYVVKSDAGRELIAALEALGEGSRYVSARLVGQVFFSTPDKYPSEENTFHKLQIYADDVSFMDGLAGFIAGGLNAGNAVAVLASEAHHQGIFQRLQSRGFDLDAIVKSGVYIPFDAAETLSSFIVDDKPDPNRLGSMVSGLIETARKGPKGRTRRVFACGECAPFLWSQGKLDAALRVEELWDELCHKYGLSTLCAYISRGSKGEREERVFQCVCTVHSAVNP